MAGLLGVTLMVLTVAAVVGSWSQAAIVKQIAAQSHATDQVQRAAYLAGRV